MFLIFMYVLGVSIEKNIQHLSISSVHLSVITFFGGENLHQLLHFSIALVKQATDRISIQCSRLIIYSLIYFTVKLFNLFKFYFF